MKCTIPEISWHNRDPVLSVDIQLIQDKENCYRVVTGGADSHVLIWYLTEGETGIANVEFASDLSRHQKAVNVVRFSPNGEMLASGDDESTIIVWKQKTDQDLPEFPSSNLEEENINKEHWIVVKILRGHLEDVYDISWSPNSTHLISGSVDNTAILWNVHKGKNLGILSEHRKFVQGVAWDPRDQYVATLSSDRHMRVYSVQSRRVIAKAGRSKLPLPPTHDLHDKTVPLFHDDTMKSFFRRLCFSPDGALLIAPSGVLETADAGKKPTSVTHVFTRACFNKPAVCLPSLQHYSVAVKCCPVLFELKPSDEPPLFKLPYRMVISVATENNILLYDTQHATPFAFIANIHYTKLTDITWSGDGRLLIASSTDGYCSIISFGDRELGIPYVAPGEEDAKENVPASPENKETKSEVKAKCQTENTGAKQTEKKLLSEKPLIDNKSESCRAADVPNVRNENPSDTKKTASVPETPLGKPSNLSVETMEVDAARPEPSEECPTTPKTPKKSSSGTPNKTPRRVQLITLSSPNRKRKLDEEKIKETIQQNDCEKLLAAETEDDVMKSEIIDGMYLDSAKSVIPVDSVQQNQLKYVDQSKEIDLKKDIDQTKYIEQAKDIDLQKEGSDELNTKPANEISESPGNKTVDFDFDSVLENTGDSILNPSFVDDSPKSHKATKKINDFSDLAESLRNSESLKNSTEQNSSQEKLSSGNCNSSVSGDNSILTSPSRDPGVRPPHVFTPPRSVHSPGRRVQLITLSSPKVKSKEK